MTCPSISPARRGTFCSTPGHERFQAVITVNKRFHGCQECADGFFEQNASLIENQIALERQERTAS